MEELKIQLHFNPADLKEIYYSDGSGSIFRFPDTRDNIVKAFVLIVISILLYNRAMKYSEIWAIFLLVIAVLLLAAVAFRLIMQIRNLFARKRIIDLHLKRLSKAESHWVILSDFTIEVREGNKSTMEKWGNLKRAVIKPFYITIEGKAENYVFPSKAMSPDEFNALANVIRSRLNSDISNDSPSQA